jgi:hypothetical protein
LPEPVSGRAKRLRLLLSSHSFVAARRDAMH